MRDSNKKRISAQKGFTLIELILVITILLSFAFFALLKVSHRPIVLENTANELVSALRYARACYEAGDSNVKFSIELVDGQNHIRIRERVTEHLNAEITVDIPIDPSIRIMSKNIHAETTKDENEKSLDGYSQLFTNSIEITYSGKTTTGKTFVLMSDKEKYYYKITIVPTTSRVHLYKLEK